MKIGHYIAAGLFAPGGIGSYLRRVVAGQVRRGHELVLFERQPSLASPGRDGFHEAAAIRRTTDDADLLRQAHDLSLDVLHAHTLVETAGEAGHGRPALVRTMHGHEAYCPSGMRHLAFPSSRPCPRGYHVAGCTWGHLVNRCGSIRPSRFLDGFHRVERERRNAGRFFNLTVSQFVRGQMIRAGYDPATCQVVHNPAPAPLPVVPPLATGEPPRFLFLGRLVPGKGAPWLLRAAARANAPVRLEIAGAGPQEPALRRLARKLGLEDRVDWLGWLDEAQVGTRMAAARALVFPSLWQEPAGLVTAEAAAAGRAVIASRVGGIPEYAAKLGHCLIVEPGDVPALAAAIDRLAEDALLAARLGLAGWHQVAAGTLSLEAHLNQLETVYTFVMKNVPLPVDTPSLEAR